jgi:YVTN family beta-propeller protein
MNKLLALSFALLLFSCKKENENEDAAPVETSFLNGRYVVNEGNFNLNNASISYISNANELTNDLYLTQNGIELGDVLQSFTVIGSNGYAVLNNSQKIEVIELDQFKRIATITGADYPRYLVDGGNGKAYLSNGSLTGDVKVIDLATNSIVQSIAVGNGPDKMLVNGGMLFVCNNGGWATDNRVTVIDLATNNVLTDIVVGDRPVDLIADAFGNIWALCSGETLYDENWNVTGHTNAMIYRINVNSLSVTGSEQIGMNGDHPMQLEVSMNGAILYYENDGVFAIDLNTGEFPGLEIIADDRGSLNVDPTNGEVWSSSVSDFVNPSTLYRYNSAGALLNSFQVGIGTNAVAFR